ncbi:unnamed protein product [Prorocentrum cordatum]|uniref:Uncharacterized protein n=1 Tax=Prorocentrum cordatum TaxID=2364126 RepID=A0ABN9VA36_9DINO|nr:unnamed protein product [Polarella glacialis]
MTMTSASDTSTSQIAKATTARPSSRCASLPSQSPSSTGGAVVPAPTAIHCPAEVSLSFNDDEALRACTRIARALFSPAVFRPLLLGGLEYNAPTSLLRSSAECVANH